MHKNDQEIKSTTEGDLYKRTYKDTIPSIHPASLIIDSTIYCLQGEGNGIKIIKTGSSKRKI